MCVCCENIQHLLYHLHYLASMVHQNALAIFKSFVSSMSILITTNGLNSIFAWTRNMNRLAMVMVWPRIVVSKRRRVDVIDIDWHCIMQRDNWDCRLHVSRIALNLVKVLNFWANQWSVHKALESSKLLKTCKIWCIMMSNSCLPW